MKSEGITPKFFVMGILRGFKIDIVFLKIKKKTMQTKTKCWIFVGILFEINLLKYLGI
jgi:hypothetical protein